MVAIIRYFIIEDFELLSLFPIVMVILFLAFIGMYPLLTLKQLKIKKSSYHKILLLKNTQQIAYYEHKRKQDLFFI